MVPILARCFGGTGTSVAEREAEGLDKLTLLATFLSFLRGREDSSSESSSKALTSLAEAGVAVGEKVDAIVNGVFGAVCAAYDTGLGDGAGAVGGRRPATKRNCSDSEPCSMVLERSVRGSEMTRELMRACAITSGSGRLPARRDANVEETLVGDIRTLEPGEAGISSLFELITWRGLGETTLLYIGVLKTGLSADA